MSKDQTAAPCCGPAQAAEQADACCAPGTKTEAIDAGASCCGTSNASATADDTVPAQPAGVAGRAGRVDGPHPVVVIGAGPVGLAAAAHLHERGLPFTVLEAGPSAGAAVAAWGHVRLFSPWRYNIDHAARRLLEAAGWAAPDADVLPTGADLVEAYLQPLAKLPQVAPYIRYDAPVVAIGRVGVDRVKTAGRENAPFVVRLATGEDVLAAAVIDASGTWRTPNVLGANGLAAHGETDPQSTALIDGALPDVFGADRDRFAGRHTVVVGAGHSAANTLLALAELAEQEPGTTITWATRGGSVDRALGGGDADALPGRGALGTGTKLLVDSGRVRLVTGFAVHAVTAIDGHAELTALDGRTLVADRIVAATGFRPDHTIAAELRLDLDPALGCTRTLAPLIDPNEHSCGTVRPHGVDELTQPEPGYFAVGMKSYGRAPTFLMATGYEQVRSITAALAGDWTAARDVQLDLPETGVCSSTQGYQAMLDDAAGRFGLAPDVPNQLISAALRHLPTAGTIAAATRAAADELGIDPDIALQLASLAGNQFDTIGQGTAAAGLPRAELGLVNVSSSGGGCCG
ncbi:NAD(P)-binding domain-containing protein [Micromonospora sp. NBC_01655]|uniref:FAD-dependent oxidoreductase n=1 Tax=Micromonospora sp. NBC_01655 TaxID=2975983 RepID=UPI00225187E8|nr:FAD-dependent oxidoreductase [Micromonospora sp. NBC_01655]MCX4471564.1 NAD(P)-binding domain-containing protein [Micromonospora sp. NBC_01655]